MAFVYWVHLPEHTDMFSEGYIGFTSKTVHERWIGHLKEVSRKRCPNYPIYNNIKKYGDSIIVDTVMEGDAEYCLYIENKLRPSEKIGWNLQEGGSRGNSSAVFTEEVRAKISAAGRGRKLNDKQKEAIRKANIGRVHSEESRAKMSATRKGRKRSCESISRHKETLKNCPWLSSQANKSVWLLANVVHVEFSKHDNISSHNLSKFVGIPAASLRAMVDKFKGGWVPETDPFWEEFSKQHKENKECPNGT